LILKKKKKCRKSHASVPLNLFLKIESVPVATIFQKFFFFRGIF
jgi:hypothetical protein